MAHLQSRYHNNTKNTYHLSSFWILLQLSPQLLNFGHRYGRQQHSLSLSFECIPHSTQWSWLDALWEFLSRWPVVSMQTPLLFCDSIFHVVTLKHPCLSDWSFEIIPISTSLLATGKIIAPAMLTSRTVGAVTSPCASALLAPRVSKRHSYKARFVVALKDQRKIWTKSLDALWDTCDLDFQRLEENWRIRIPSVIKNGIIPYHTGHTKKG